MSCSSLNSSASAFLSSGMPAAGPYPTILFSRNVSVSPRIICCEAGKFGSPISNRATFLPSDVSRRVRSTIVLRSWSLDCFSLSSFPILVLSSDVFKMDNTVSRRSLTLMMSLIKSNPFASKYRFLEAVLLISSYHSRYPNSTPLGDSFTFPNSTSFKRSAGLEYTLNEFSSRF